MPQPTPKTLLFDVFGTVVDWRTGITTAAKTFLARHNANPTQAPAFADAWRALYSPAMEKIRSHQRPFTRLDVLHRENLEQILPAFGINPKTVPEAELANFNKSWHNLDPRPDSVPGLLRLKQHYIIAPLSNGNIALMLNMAKRAALPWDAILGAELVQAYKPAPETYLKTAELLGLHPNELCMVAAHNSDLAAARNCGLQTAFVPRPLEHGPNQKTDLTPEQEWDITAPNLLALAEALGA